MKEGTDAARAEKTGAAVRKSVFFFFVSLWQADKQSVNDQTQN